MQKPPIPKNEKARLAALNALDLLDSPIEERFDQITRLCAKALNVPICLVSLIDTNRQWFKSCYGLDEKQTSRSVSFCGHAILNDVAFIIPDAKKDKRFADNPLVTGKHKIRFYAGIPLNPITGKGIGTLCVLDRKPRHLSEADVKTLRAFARWVELEMGYPYVLRKARLKYYQ